MTGTTNLGLTPISSGQAQKEVTANENFEILASAIAGSLTVAMADANQTLTDAQVQQSATFLCTGALTADRNLIVPIDVIRIYDVANNTTGSHNIVVKTPSGTGITIPAGGEQIVRCDGTNVVAVSGASTSAGTVTSVATGTGLTGGPITNSGTIGLAAIADDSLLANITGSSAAPVPVTPSALFDDVFGNAQGDILFRTSGGWVILAPGTSGKFLQTQGASADIQWASAGTVTSVGVSSTDLSISGSPITGSGSITLNINNNAVTNAKAAQMVAHTFKGNNTGSTANSIDLTATQLTAELNAMVGDSGSGGTKGLVPAPASGDAAAAKYLKADGTWAAVSGASGGTVTSVATGTGLTGGPITGTGTLSLATIATLNVLANITGGTAAPIANTLTALIDAAIGSTQGVILYRGASAWSVLSPGTTGQFLETQGASANPKWANPGASSPRIVSATSSSTTYTADWSAADEIRLTLASATVVITNNGAVDGQKCVLTLIQDGTGGRLATWGTESDFGAAGTAVLSSAASARDHLGFLFNNTASKYDAVSFAGGF